VSFPPVKRGRVSSARLWKLVRGEGRFRLEMAKSIIPKRSWVSFPMKT
jgi:hypothetical protein